MMQIDNMRYTLHTLLLLKEEYPNILAFSAEMLGGGGYLHNTSVISHAFSIQKFG